jgi:hypothetical protein
VRQAIACVGIGVTEAGVITCREMSDDKHGRLPRERPVGLRRLGWYPVSGGVNLREGSIKWLLHRASFFETGEGGEGSSRTPSAMRGKVAFSNALVAR